ncbi:MAG: hypothetical protein KC917_20430, partial [Candidatus Omnitrophica bacterium]|nr:hypothetical protein [Candidatus Omnitrophota bacterium]
FINLEKKFPPSFCGIELRTSIWNFGMVNKPPTRFWRDAAGPVLRFLLDIIVEINTESGV